MRKVTVSGCALVLAIAPLLRAAAPENDPGPVVALQSEKKPSPMGATPLEPESVAVPETLGATLLAGAGFLFMLRRRRFS